MKKHTQDTTADGWGQRYLNPFTNEDPHWEAAFHKTASAVSSKGIVILIGKRGSGKTRLASEVSRVGDFPADIIGRDKTSAYRRASEIFIDLRDSLRSKSGAGEGTVIKHLSGVGLLVIDEFQERGESEWENRIITTILDRRYADELPTILIANLGAAEMAAKISDSVISRVSESGGVIECRWESFREARK